MGPTGYNFLLSKSRMVLNCSKKLILCRTSLRFFNFGLKFLQYDPKVELGAKNTYFFHFDTILLHNEKLRSNLKKQRLVRRRVLSSATFEGTLKFLEKKIWGGDGSRTPEF